MRTETQPGMDALLWAGETPDEVLQLGAKEYCVADARAIVRRFAEVTTSLDVDAFVSGFTADSVTAFNQHPEIQGRDALRSFMEPRFAKLAEPGADYRCRKFLRSLNGNVFGVIWLSEWTDVQNDQPMQQKGVESWVMDDGRIGRWDAAAFVWPV
jgi:nuclear transport factor 2 (NTF2) superfamily protein